MGLLEKAEKIQSDEGESDKEPPAAVIVSEPEPVQKAEKPVKKKRSRKKRTKKAKKERTPKVIPDGFEPAGRTRGLFRYLVDFTVNF